MTGTAISMRSSGRVSKITGSTWWPSSVSSPAVTEAASAQALSSGSPSGAVSTRPMRRGAFGHSPALDALDDAALPRLDQAGDAPAAGLEADQAAARAGDADRAAA